MKIKHGFYVDPINNLHLDESAHTVISFIDSTDAQGPFQWKDAEPLWAPKFQPIDLGWLIDKLGQIPKTGPQDQVDCFFLSYTTELNFIAIIFHGFWILQGSW